MLFFLGGGGSFCRLCPCLCNFHLLYRVYVSIYDTEPVPLPPEGKPLGMADGRITDTQITIYGSVCYTGTPKYMTCQDYARLIKQHFLLESDPDDGPRVEVDLMCPSIITGVEFAGFLPTALVNKFYIQYSMDGLSWRNITDACTNKTKVNFTKRGHLRHGT